MLKVIAVVVLAAGTAHADRCADGVAALAKNDLPRAALYLDGCDDAEPKAVNELKKKLEASSLSVLEISSNPSGLDAEVDALPGEHLLTPATVYVPAGEHEVHAGPLVKKVTTVPHARSVVIFEDAAPKPPPAPKPGTADFRDEAPEADQPTGPPPPTQHRPMMPCKFTNSCTEAGEQIEDPLAGGADRPPPRPALYDLGVRAGAGEFVGGLGATFALAGTFVAPWDDASVSTHPWLLLARADWSKRRGGDSLGVSLAVGKVIAAPDTAWLSVGAGVRAGGGIAEMPLSGGDVTVNNNESGAVALVELALRRLPITVGARYEQGFWQIYSDRGYEHAVIIDLGIGKRGYR